MNRVRRGMKKGLFLDGDGVLWPDAALGGILSGFNQAKKSLINLKSSIFDSENFVFLVVSNQTLAARNLIPEQEFRDFVSDFFERLINLELLDGYAICFHHPNALNESLRSTNCSCRKPRPGMINSLLEKNSLTSEQSLIVGDRITDIIAGQHAGLSLKVLLTGPRSFEFNDIYMAKSETISIRLKPASDLPDAVQVINEWRINN